MFCPKCGTQINENVQFCPGCGEKIQNKPSSAPQAASNNLPGLFSFAAVGMLFLSMIFSMLKVLKFSASLFGYSYSTTATMFVEAAGWLVLFILVYILAIGVFAIDFLSDRGIVPKLPIPTKLVFPILTIIAPLLPFIRILYYIIRANSEIGGIGSVGVTFGGVLFILTALTAMALGTLNLIKIIKK